VQVLRAPYVDLNQVALLVDIQHSCNDSTARINVKVVKHRHSLEGQNVIEITFADSVKPQDIAKVMRQHRLEPDIYL
jgi:hypothetical protein